MTTPAGDLPDWQTLVTPMIVPAAAVAVAGGGSTVIFTSPNPFRVWGMYLAAEYDSTAAFNAPNSIGIRIQDGALINALAMNLALEAASTVDSGQLAVSVPGLTPSLHAGAYTLNLVVDPLAANTNVTARAGIYYSQP